MPEEKRRDQGLVPTAPWHRPGSLRGSLLSAPWSLLSLRTPTLSLVRESTYESPLSLGVRHSGKDSRFPSPFRPFPAVCQWSCPPPRTEHRQPALASTPLSHPRISFSAACQRRRFHAPSWTRRSCSLSPPSASPSTSSSAFPPGSHWPLALRSVLSTVKNTFA